MDPSGKITRRSDGSKGTPLWYHEMTGDGRPAALQFRVNGSSRAATASAGCSRIRGRCWAEIKIVVNKNAIRNAWNFG